MQYFYSNDNQSFFHFDFYDADVFKKLKNPLHSSKEELLNFIKSKEKTSITSEELIVAKNIYKTRSGFQLHNIFIGSVIPVNYDDIVSVIENF
ncbi:hypothetical protein ACTOJ1_001441 [Shigella flexneri]